MSNINKCMYCNVEIKEGMSCDKCFAKMWKTSDNERAHNVMIAGGF